MKIKSCESYALTKQGNVYQMSNGCFKTGLYGGMGVAASALIVEGIKDCYKSTPKEGIATNLFNKVKNAVKNHDFKQIGSGVKKVLKKTVDFVKNDLDGEEKMIVLGFIAATTLAGVAIDKIVNQVRAKATDKAVEAKNAEII